MKKYAFGIDVGGTTVKCGLFTAEGDVLDKWEITTRTSDNGSHILPDVAATILKKLEEKQIDKEEVVGIGIGIPGPVDESGVTSVAVNLHWGRTDIVGIVEGLTGIRTKAGNDANVAALGEQWKGGGQGSKSLIMVTLGTGVGGGIIVDERILAGVHGAGGEIGHAHVADYITDPCNCGNCGCLEQVASATGIVRLAKEELAACDEESLLRSDKAVTAKSVFDALKKGDAVAVRIVERFAKYLGTALANFAAVTDPEAIVIGGGVSKAGPILIDYVSKYYRMYAFPSCKDATIALATLGNDAGIYGAAKMVL